MKSPALLLIFFILFLNINCDFSEKLQNGATTKSAEINNKDIKLTDLEILNPNYFSEFPDAQSKEWRPVKIPFIRKVQDTFFKNLRILWLRGKLKIEPSGMTTPSAYHGIRLGLVAADNSIYINKKTAGDFKWIESELDKFVYPCSYVLPSSITLKQTNEVYIRFITNREYISLITNIALQDKQSYVQSERWNNFIYNQIPMGIAILLTCIMVFLFYNYFFQKKKPYLIYGLYLFNIVLFFMLVYAPVSILPPKLNTTLFTALVPFSILLTVLIFQSLYGIYFLKQNIISGVAIISASLFIIFNRTSVPFYLDGNISSLLLIISIISFIYSAYLIRLLNSLKTDRFKYFLSISLLIFLVIMEALHSLGIIYNIWHQYFDYIYVPPLTALFIIINEARENKFKKAELETLYGKLKNHRTDNNQQLTESAEKKIIKVIDFIKENFTSDLSREGLASAVDLNPNYMSKLFYKHTGKKINEYINYLRIEDAARQLADPKNKLKIIDIALASGFESLSTFNRAFKKIYKETPTDYKNKNYSN